MSLPRSRTPRASPAPSHKSFAVSGKREVNKTMMNVNVLASSTPFELTKVNVNDIDNVKVSGVELAQAPGPGLR